MKSKLTRLLIPIVFSRRTTLPRLVRCISGMVLSSISLSKLHNVNNLKHLPGATLPALPALWLALALEQATTYNDSIPVRGLKVVYLQNPQSMTNKIFSMVMEVSAMLVAITTFLEPLGVGSKILTYYSLGSVA